METLKLNEYDNIQKNYTGIIEYPNGTIKYFINGELHREDGPAFIYPNGDIYYYLKGFLHRRDGPAIIRADGTLEYFLNGLRHREDGPSCINYDGSFEYCLNGKLHREDGPAICSGNIKQWFIKGEEITKKVNEWLKGKTNIPPYEKWDNNTRLIFKLTFGVNL